MTMTWIKGSRYSIKAAEGPYRVSRATVLDTATRELVDMFTAWYDQERLGDYRGADGPALAREACEAHQASLIAPAQAA